MSLCLWRFLVFDEVKHVEKLREHAEGVMDKSDHCAGFISTSLKFKYAVISPFILDIMMCLPHYLLYFIQRSETCLEADGTCLGGDV